jgi:hypothetical protein
MSNEIDSTTNHPHILDMGQLFLYSGLVDQIRDTSAFFVVNNVEDTDALRLLVRQYEVLREKLVGVLSDQAGSQLPTWAPYLQEILLNAATLHAGAASLARYLDLLHQSPQFLVQQKLVSANAAKVAAQIDAGEDGDELSTGLPDGVVVARHGGQYL